MSNQEAKQEAAAVKEAALECVAVEKIEVVENVRKNFDPAAMKELTESIRHNGVLVPLLLAKNGKPGTYRLIAGERRLRAAKALDLKSVPAQIVEADAAKLDELQVLENLHRADLGPIEEARAFKKLLDGGKHTIEGLAKQVDKSVKYVTRSIRLLELPKEAIKGIEEGKLSPEHGHQLLRLPEKKREALAAYALAPKWGGVLPTIHELKQEIERRLERDLAQACFPKDREFAGVMPCAACPFNTGNQNVLFDGAQSGKCTDGACFTKKTNAFLREFKERAAKKLEGLKFVGMASQMYGGEVKGGVVLRPEEIKSGKVKALIEKEPEKFGFAVLKPSRYGSNAPTAAVVCLDKSLLEAKIRKTNGNAPQAMTQEEREREQFIQGAEVRALFAEAARMMQAVRKEHLVDIVLNLDGCGAAYEAVGVQECEDIRAELGKLKEKDLLRLAWLCTVGPWKADEALKPLGVSVQKVRKDARTQAVAEWEAQKQAQAEEK